MERGRVVYMNQWYKYDGGASPSYWKCSRVTLLC